MPEADNLPGTPGLPAGQGEPDVPGGPGSEPGQETVAGAAPVRAFVCARCHKGRLDPAGLKMGEAMACPECGARTKVTLEHLMGEERASRRQKIKKTFDDMSDEEKADFLAEKGAAERFYYFLRYKLGPRGMILLYLAFIVVVATLIIGQKLASGEYELRSVKWWVVVLWIVGGAAIGVAGHFGYIAAMYYYKKHIAPKNGGGRTGSRRASVRRRASSTRKGPPADQE
jgi:DNA-directed RNA polymerase subunit RPC12/RpoP